MKKNVWKILAAILSLAVILSLSTVAVFADEPSDTDVSTDAGAGAETDASTKAETDAGTTAADDHDHSGESGSGNNSGNGSNNSGNGSNSKKTNKYGIPTLIILGVILIGVLVWWLRDRERAAKLWRSFKSEFKKIVWANPHETLKNTILVVVAIIVFAIVFGVTDYLLSTLIVWLGRVI